ncbi:MAG: RNA polymerase sigma factor [bacterium]
MVEKAAAPSPQTLDMARRLHFQKAVQGNEEAFWALIEPFGGLIYSVAYAILKDHERSRDILHEAYIKSYASLSNLRDPDKLSSWLHSLTRNLCYDAMRKDSRLGRVAPQLFEHGARVVSITEATESLIKKEELESLEKALASLPEPFRLILGMKYMNRYSCKEIALALDIGVEAVKSRLFEARRLVARRMEQYDSGAKEGTNGGPRT